MVLTSSQTIIRPSFFTHEAAPRSTPEPADKAASEIYMNSPKILSWTVNWSKASNEGSQRFHNHGEAPTKDISLGNPRTLNDEHWK